MQPNPRKHANVSETLLAAMRRTNELFDSEVVAKQNQHCVHRQTLRKTECSCLHSLHHLDFVRTMEMILGLQPLNISDALGVPMADVFDLNQTIWNYTATASTMLVGTGLPLPTSVAKLRPLKPTQTGAYWAATTKGMDFSAEDRIDFDLYNHILWTGLMGDKPYPAAPTGKDLRQNRQKLLARYRKSAKQKPARDPKTGTD